MSSQSTIDGGAFARLNSDNPSFPRLEPVVRCRLASNLLELG